MATTNSEFTGVFVTDESGNHYLLPNDWANRLRISPDDKRDMAKISGSEVSGYDMSLVKLVMMYFGAYRDEKGKWSMEGADQADLNGDGVVNVQDYNIAKRK